MILLRCARLPDEADKDSLARLVRAKLPNNANNGYISALESKTNPLSARESLYALSILCDMIAQLPVKIDPSTLVLARGECGKPYFVDSNLKFNIAHSQGMVACALSDLEEVGVDIEAALPDRDRAKKIAERFFSQNDIQSVENDPQSFAWIWSENEAEAKFFGENLSAFLKNKRNSGQDGKSVEFEKNTTVHRFKFANVPVTLCTSRDFSTIFFDCQA
ncbi:MAG: 4'-phosphopantetheinyl transferase superfamily protein [Clostridia bacterium]|nr:4'-phosphopantetheinyl transferase superfamily protein [Clostridia bacterium]